MGRQASRSSSLLAVLGILWACGVLITLIGGVYIHWIVILAATVVNVRTAAAIGRPPSRRR